MKDIKLGKPKIGKFTLIYTTAISLFAVFSAAVSTFAWFQAQSSVEISTSSDTATITVSAPEMVKFYYFKGNGAAGTDGYTGYSKDEAAFGNTTNVVYSNGKYSLDGGSNKSNIYTSAITDGWTKIDLNTQSEINNAFDFSRMRPGCYYSFCIDTTLATSTLTLSFDWTNGTSKGITGDNVSPKRYLYDSGTTTKPLNLLMIMNGYCNASSAVNGTGYITDTVGLTSSLSLTDKLAFSPVAADGSKTASYTFLNATTTSTNHYIYFTVFMGTPTKSDAYSYNSTNTIEYYQVDSTYSTYSPFDGLKTTLTTVAVS